LRDGFKVNDTHVHDDVAKVEGGETEIGYYQKDHKK